MIVHATNRITAQIARNFKFSAFEAIRPPQQSHGAQTQAVNYYEKTSVEKCLQSRSGLAGGDLFQSPDDRLASKKARLRPAVAIRQPFMRTALRTRAFFSFP
jgi:hypothetical protein